MTENEIETLKEENEELKKRCSDYEMLLKRFVKDEELSYMNCEPKSRLELLEEIDELKKTCQENLENMIEAKRKLNEIKNYLGYDIPHELMNEATNKIWRIL